MKPHISQLMPGRLASRPRDARGYPIPFIVFNDAAGKPHFTINDQAKVAEVIRKKLCALCGTPLRDNIWFIGGPGAAFHEFGAYLDPPAHKDCACYALRVCPFLATRYSKLIEDKLLRPDHVPHDAVLVTEESAKPDQPAFFVLAKAPRYELIDRSDEALPPLFVPKRPWMDVQFWREGKPISPAEAEALLPKTGYELAELKWWPKI